jgi:phage gp29-like protein
VLGQTGTTDTGQHVGTATAHENVRDDIEAWDAMQLAATLNRDLVRPIIDLNKGPRKAYPRLVIGRAEGEDTTALVDTLVKLVDRGMRVEQSVIRDRLGIADPDHNAALLHPLGAAPVEHGAANVAAQSTRVAAHAQQPDQPDAIDALIAEELADWEPLVSPLIAPLHALLAECESLEEFQRRLPELVQDQDPDTLAEAMAQALFVARLSGETADG